LPESAWSDAAENHLGEENVLVVASTASIEPAAF